jgi:hypothetical protein
MNAHLSASIQPFYSILIPPSPPPSSRNLPRQEEWLLLHCCGAPAQREELQWHTYIHTYQLRTGLDPVDHVVLWQVQSWQHGMSSETRGRCDWYWSYRPARTHDVRLTARARRRMAARSRARLRQRKIPMRPCLRRWRNIWPMLRDNLSGLMEATSTLASRT